MAQEGEKEVSALLARFPVWITYRPTKAEVDFIPLVQSATKADRYVIQPNRSLDPATEVSHAREIAGTRDAVVLVPGRRFDATGTRHGKGAGWYDRFLATAPQAWTRIGFCFDDQFSDEPLVLQSWDEPMDYVVVIRTDVPVLYTTHARPGIL